MTAASIEGGTPPRASSIMSLKVCHPSRPDVVPLFRHAAAEFAGEHGASRELRADIALAVSEAVTNAVKHADAREGETVAMTASVLDHWLEIRVRDRGTGFGTVVSDGLGLGLSIIARLSDQLTIRQEGSGTELRMGFALPRA